MKKQELLKYVGSIEQIGGIKDYTLNEGKCKGVRVIEINTGNVQFSIIPDRCMDIAQTFYKGRAVSWISKTGITSPEYYDKEGKGFLRGFYGGLVTTCGLKNIGRPYNDKGMHGRISNTPAERISVSAEWQDDDYVMTVSGEMRESVVFGENLLLKRTITAKLFADEFIISDTLINEGFKNEEIALGYHCNYGYPLVREGAKIINARKEFEEISSPTHNKEEECIEVTHFGESVTCGIENDKMGAYITYSRNTLPEFLLWRMPGESEYVIGLEPRTTKYGGENIKKNNGYVTLKPFEEYKTYLKFSFKDI